MIFLFFENFSSVFTYLRGILISSALPIDVTIIPSIKQLSKSMPFILFVTMISSMSSFLIPVKNFNLKLKDSVSRFDSSVAPKFCFKHGRPMSCHLLFLPRDVDLRCRLLIYLVFFYVINNLTESVQFCF